jgi:hypothetical protein
MASSCNQLEKEEHLKGSLEESKLADMVFSDTDMAHALA